MNCGQETASEIDHEVMKMLKEAYEEGKETSVQNTENHWIRLQHF